MNLQTIEQLINKYGDSFISCIYSEHLEDDMCPPMSSSSIVDWMYNEQNWEYVQKTVDKYSNTFKID